MANKFGRFFLSLLFLSAVSMQASNAESASTEVLSQAMTQEINAVVPNFGVVSDHLLRGGQPREGGLAALKKAGVRTVVNLRDGFEDINSEKQVASKLGIKFVSIPMSVFKTANKEQVDKFLKTVRDAKDGRVFVHCRQGMDRCGTMVAMYRMNEEHWTAKHSYDEMLSYGFHPFLVGLRWSVFANEAAVLSAKAIPSDGTNMNTDLSIRTAPIGKQILNSLVGAEI